MLPKPPDEMQYRNTLSRITRICGLDYRPPVTLRENLSESYASVKKVRGAFSSILNWGRR